MAVREIDFEQGPIRPPSEAYSLLLRLTRNCPWNRCLFCPVYKKRKFSRRSLEEIKADLEAMALAAEKIGDMSRQSGFGGRVNREVAALVHAKHPHIFQIAFWLLHGGERVFLQDGDSLLLPTDQLVEVLKLLKEKFPTVNRVTTYARSRTLLRRSVQELEKLKKAGLNRIHVGLESGSDRVLEFMKKGVTGDQHVEAGRRVKEAGLSLSEYVLLGLGGTDLWEEHARDTARVINEINPDFIRMRTLTIRPGSPLADEVREGNFKPLGDDEIVREEELFLENLAGIDSYIYSDHILNLLEDVQGQLPEDKEAIMAVVQGYLSLPEKERDLFKLGRRSGCLRSPQDLQKQSERDGLEQLYRRLQVQGISVDQYLEQQLLQFI